MALHVLLYLLLRAVGEPVPPSMSRGDGERIRLVWSVKESPSALRAAAARVPARERAAPATADARASIAATTDLPAVPILEARGDDTWSLRSEEATEAGKETEAVTGFARDVFLDQGVDPFAPANHLPGVHLRDSSFGGRLQAEARRRACGSLRGALADRPESTAAIMASMRRWHCAL